MRRYQVKLTGITPFLMHHDNIEWSDKMSAWKDDAMNKKGSKAGDDRSPAWRWIGACYHDGKRLCIPQDNIMRCLMEAGAMVPVPGGKSGKTFKSQTQSGMMSGEPFWPLLVNGNEIAWEEIKRLISEDDFIKHNEVADRLGFMLYLKRAKIGQSKHIRVRPRFDAWETNGTLSVWDEQLTDRVLTDVLNFAGQYKGLGDWRPGGKTPGPHGMFKAEVKRI